MRVTRLGHLVCNPPPWMFYRIWPLSFWPCPGSRVGSTRGYCCWNFRPGSSCQGMAVLGAFGGGWQLDRQTGSVLSLAGRKRIKSEGKSGSLPNSSSTSNQTCFLSYSSFCGEALCQHALPLDSQTMGCSLSFLSEQWSHLSAGWNCGGLKVEDQHWLGCEGEGLWCHLNPLLPLEWVLLPDLDHPFCPSSSRACSSSTRPQEHLQLLEGNSVGPFHSTGQLWTCIWRDPITAPSRNLLAAHGWTHLVLPCTWPYRFTPWLTGGQSPRTL